MASFNWFTRSEHNSPTEAQSETQSTEQSHDSNKPERPDVDSSQSNKTNAEPAIAEDYLSWAKAAYQNIQKQKASKQTDNAAEQTLAKSASELASEDTQTETRDTDGSAQHHDPATKDTLEETSEHRASEADAKDAAAAAESYPVEQVSSHSEVEAQDKPAQETEISSKPTPQEASQLQSAAVAAPNSEAASSTVTPSGDEGSTNEAPTESTESPTSRETLPFWAQAEAERKERLERLKATAIEEPEAQTPEPTPSTSTASSQVELDEGFDENFIWSAGVLAAQGRRPDDISVEEITWLKRLRQGLGKTRRSLINQLRSIVGQGPLNQDAVMEIEALLLQADVGIEATDYVIEALQARLRQEALPPEAAISYLKEILRNMLDQPFEGDYDQAFAPEKDTLNIWLMTGVNGAGKTTTIGKLAHLARKSDYSCLIAAADTFRAAAVEQVKIWGQRSNVDVIANPGKNTDPAAVVYDGIEAAKSRNIELLLVDTAGRLQNKKNLMDELSKIRRIVDRRAPDAKVESLLVLDATLGQNGLRQAEVFSEAANLSGVVLTKLDGTAKGGVALAVVQQMGLPIRFIGAGEGIEDLRPFSSYEFVEALLSG